MANDTSIKYRNNVMYSVFIRNYSQEGTFEALRQDLNRIQRLGVDIIWLLPIHPIGLKERKGSLGSPYAIQDYRRVNPEYGTLNDFKRLVDDIHSLGMKVIIDVVYNHTSPDSWLAVNHPKWFYKKENGKFGNKIGEWLDVIDLDYSKKELWEYQIDTLKYWASMVDGFRCDVAPLIPLEFWKEARSQVEKIRPGCLWISESVEPEFIIGNRSKNVPTLSDSEIFQAFDISYEYDIYHYFRDFFECKIPLYEYVDHLNLQESIYPNNYIKLRFLENHDNLRAKFIIPNATTLKNMTAFLYFQKGMTLLYAGQEVQAVHRPGLFDKDIIHWNMGVNISDFLSRLYTIKQSKIFTDSAYTVQICSDDILYATHRSKHGTMVGIFSTSGIEKLISVTIPDGKYTNLIDGCTIDVSNQKISFTGNPLILCPQDIENSR